MTAMDRDAPAVVAGAIVLRSAEPVRTMLNITTEHNGSQGAVC